METSYMVNTAERHLIPSYDGTVSPSESWWELIHHSTGIRYFWNSVTNAIQYERPFCLPPSTTCSLGRTIMECSDVIDILPSEHTHVASSTSNGPSMGRSKDALYLCFCHNECDGLRWWYDLNLGGGEEIVSENGSKQELITTMLGEPIQDISAAFISINSLIYRIYLNVPYPTPRVQVLDTVSQQGSSAPSWKEFTPLAKARAHPWAISMGGKIYVVGAEMVFSKGFISAYELNDIEVLTSPESGKWETLPIHSPHNFANWLKYFVVPFEDHGKLVLGDCYENCLYLYDVCTHHLEKIDLNGVCFISKDPDLPPVVVGNRLFFFDDASIVAYDLVERSFWKGTIVGIDNCFIRATCKKRKGPRLVYLGGGKLCLICYKPHTPHEFTTTVHCCVFGVPDFNEQGGKRSLHGRLHSVHKYYIGDAAVYKLFNVLVI